MSTWFCGGYKYAPMITLKRMYSIGNSFDGRDKDDFKGKSGKEQSLTLGKFVVGARVSGLKPVS